MTKAEFVLWGYLRGASLGVKFLRQHVVGQYIVDFLCRKNLLVIEVDGGYHSEGTQPEKDAERTKWLENHGYTVIRFTNEEILFDIDNVINKIRDHISPP